MLLGDRHPEHPDPRELFDDGQRDQLVAVVPLLCVRCDLPLCKAAHLIANHLQRRIIDADIPECALPGFGEPGAERQTGCGGAGRQGSRRSSAQWRDLTVVETEILGPREFPLRHGNAAGELGEIFAIGGFEDQRLYLAELSAFVEPHRPIAHLAQCLDIARHPGQRVCGQLFGGEALGFDVAPGGYPHDEPCPSGRKEQLCRAERAPGLGQQRCALGRHGCAVRLPISPAAIGSGRGRPCGTSGRRRA